MDHRAIFDVAAAGMALEKRRLDVVALNLANLHASQAPDATPVRPLKVVAGPVRLDFAGLMTAPAPLPVLRSTATVAVDAPPRLVHEPGHPHADERGFVRYPAVEQTQEMIVAMTAVRAYEANVAVVGLARSMAAKALEIGGR